ncbi:aldo/keto reductase [Pseudogemmobacter bohemicus]|uniref:aldo/keto reductase n=1 Tax=Pseudogemmobacter bohemicus TaxID=2250708 RepID=UPI000DD42D47|nr:aldo/keto reductase [Pseudogemmobacter bohemicus]
MNILFSKTWQRSFGTFPLKDSVLEAAIAAAIETGYRAFDTAQMYENESTTGAALAASGLPRSALCVTTKVGVGNFTTGKFMPSVEASLAALQLDQVDMLLLHWPDPSGDNARSLDLLQEAQARGLTRHIGLSNYTAAMMREARARVSGPLVVNQVEFHPLLDQSRLLAAANETGIPLSSYCSVARGEVFRYPLFAEIGASYGKSAAQIVLRWILQKGLPITTMSTKPENIRANFEVMDFTLSSIDMARIDALNATGFRVVGRDKVPYAPEFD